MSTRNHTAWRENIRKAYAAGTSQATHRGPWGNPGLYRLPYGSDPVNDGWRHFSPRGAVSLVVDETYEEDYNLSTTYTDPEVEPVSKSDELQETMLFQCLVPKMEVREEGDSRDENPFGTPSETDICRRFHRSATPYGEGLYDMAGYFSMDGSEDRYLHEIRGTSDGFERTITESRRHRRTLHYQTSAQILDGVQQTPQIQGLDTRIRMTAMQTFHGPAVARQPISAPIPGQSMLPYETNPDGDDLDGLAVEEYWTDEAARKLLAGRWDAETVRNSGSGSDTLVGGESSTVWSFSFGRSGTFAFLVT